MIEIYDFNIKQSKFSEMYNKKFEISGRCMIHKGLFRKANGMSFEGFEVYFVCTYDLKAIIKLLHFSSSSLFKSYH